jgi:hypothetical protein
MEQQQEQNQETVGVVHAIKAAIAYYGMAEGGHGVLIKKWRNSLMKEFDPKVIVDAIRQQIQEAKTYQMPGLGQIRDICLALTQKQQTNNYVEPMIDMGKEVNKILKEKQREQLAGVLNPKI